MREKLSDLWTRFNVDLMLILMDARDATRKEKN